MYLIGVHLIGARSYDESSGEGKAAGGEETASLKRGIHISKVPSLEGVIGANRIDNIY